MHVQNCAQHILNLYIGTLCSMNFYESGNNALKWLVI